MMIKGVVHIIDDDPSLRSSLDSLVRSVGLTARAYGSAEEFLAAKPGDRPRCLVLDVRLPGGSGLDFHERLSAHGDAVPTVMMTGHGDIPMSVRAMKAGAVDFLPKPFRDQDMIDAILAALARDAERANAQIAEAGLHARYDSLTERERQVMALVTAGKMNKQAAFELGLSEITVKIHRGSAMRKMQARTLADLVRMAEALARHPRT